MNNVLITGSTGSIGFNLLRKLLENTDDYFYLLIRANKNNTSEERIFNLLKQKYDEKTLDSYMKRIQVISGNITESKFSLDEKQFNSLAENINYIYHSAASISFTLPLDEARKINLTGTQNVLELAEKCFELGNLKHFYHISTSYVLGDCRKLFYENQLDIGQHFNNTYEQTKFETELLVHKYIDNKFPITIFRPSIVGSDYNTGEITKSNIIFDFIKRLCQGRLKEVICDNDSSLNIIPMDFVIDAIFKISQNDDCLGKTYNLSNNYNINVRELAKYVCEASDSPIPEFISIKDKDKADRFVQMRLAPFLPYISESHTFDNTNTLAALHTDCKTKKIDFGCIQRCIKYCKENALLN
ncbi:MAG: SDR family oxidoreductase [Clostridium sp.]